MKAKNVQPRHVAFTALALFALTWLFPRAAWIQQNMPEWCFKLVAGSLLGTVAAMSYATLKFLIRKFRVGGLSAIEPNHWMIPFTAVFYLIVLGTGLTIWLVGWEGKNTGAIYGLGILLGGILVDAGVGPIIASDD